MFRQATEFFSRWNLAISFFVAMGVGLFGIYVSIICFKRYGQKPNSILLRLALAILFWSLAAALDPLFYTMGQLFPDLFFDVISFGSLIEFGFAGIANLWLMQFIIHVFYEKSYPFLAYIIRNVSRAFTKSS